MLANQIRPTTLSVAIVFRYIRFWPKTHRVLPFLAIAQKKTLALIEPRIFSADTRVGIPQDEIWQTLIVARTVTQWCRKAKSALVQIDNPSNRTITLKRKTVVGTISSPVTAISPRTASALTHNHSELQARIGLFAALDESF